jgi:hypothetical protein
MQANTQKQTDKPSPQIEFLQFHQPALKDGDYEITVTQEIETKGSDIQNITQTTFTTTQKFSVLGDRFSLNPQDIHAVFPPAGSLGEHSNVLPHIILNRSTLPWERQTDEQIDSNVKDSLPWLALLLFDEDEKPTPKIVKLEELKNTTSCPAKFPNFDLEIGQHDDDKVTVIDVKKEQLEAIMPTGNDLAYLAHVRQGKDADGKPIGEELAVIICNRLPKKDGSSTVHLVSLEGRYQNDGFDYQKVGNEELIRLVSLTNWSFACVDEKQSFKGLLTHLNLNLLFSLEPKLENDLNHTSITANLRQEFRNKGNPLSQAATIASEQSSNEWRIIDENRLYCVRKQNNDLNIYKQDSSTLRLPQANKENNQHYAEAENYLKMGYVALPHYLRKGAKTISWYHSPLAPGENKIDATSEPKLPVHAADELIRYNPANGMFDVSYAAAWELGRLLALQSKNFSIALYNWKRTHAQQLIKAEQQLTHLPIKGQSVAESIKLPDTITSWFTDLSLFKGVPFNYLVPDERLLPTESIRFFYVDRLWVECLLDGAFSIGRVMKSDHQQDSTHETSPAANPHETVSGFLLRSDVVAGWPDLQVDGYDEVVETDDCVPDKEKLPLLRMERLSQNVLICLFEGEVKTVDIHQKPEAMHFGFDTPDEQHKSYYKKLKDSKGKELTDVLEVEPESQTNFWKDKTKRVINICKFAEAISDKLQSKFCSLPSSAQFAFTSAQFALEMIEGVQKIRFKKT